MLVDAGEKLLISVWVGNDRAPTRHCVGEVISATDTAMRIVGYDFHLDFDEGRYSIRRDPRTRILSFTDPRLIITVLPLHTRIDDLQVVSDETGIYLGDGAEFRRDLKEFLPLGDPRLEKLKKAVPKRLKDSSNTT